MAAAVLAASAAAACLARTALADAAAEVKALTGARTRIVWARDAGDGHDAFAGGDTFKLMGLDTHDGRGEREILATPSNYAKPLVTPRGGRVVFTNRRTDKTFVVNWDGSNLREITAGWAADVWLEPATGVEWVYVRTGSGNATPIVRYQIDKPDVREPVWDKTPVDIDSFQLSADGTRAAGMFPWPESGVAELPGKTLKIYGKGCWTALAPDNSCRFWHLDGSHRNLILFDAGGANKRTVPISNAFGIDGCEVYHPRWSNNARIITLTGPYRGGIPAGGSGVQLFMGKFNAAFTAVDQWVQVTCDNKADLFGDAWIDPGN